MRLGKALLMAVAMTFAAACAGSSSPPLPSEGLVAHYQLDGDAKDELSASPGVATSTEAVSDRNGNEAGALRFNGVDAFIEIEHTDAVSLSNEFTIAAWIKAEPSDGQGHFWSIFEKSDPERGGHSRYGLWLRDGLLWTCYEAFDNSEQPCADTTVPVPVDAWHHVAAVRSGRRAILYLDGVEVVNSFVGNRDISQTEFNVFIGTDRYEEPSVWLHADLDDIRIYNRPLTPDELLQLAGG